MQGGLPSRNGVVEAAAEQTGHSDIFVDREQDVCQQSDFGAPKSTPGADKTISASPPPRPRHHELRSGITALMLACADEQQPLESIRKLIQSGESVWQKEKAYGRTCLHFAAAHNRWQVVELLVSASRQQARFGSNNSKGGMSGGLWSWMCGCCSGGSSGNGSGRPARTKCRYRFMEVECSRP
ncbi:hypothetical protein CEUSTIGMA_g12484.t1 [Chlamydomonas eustigma]|uniref:Uncharacterized protein n=1 Tax=Chlamydomonas eustigma TaxID=1157962 RepID=A0A250XPQ1_9CHLO|nr:hypothetical protein CEUSTIGMA_g12484.t1 [Chlamydomonas eustigma]|eukprot:GAX85064.1 hypothetical protein CEUSTIGMA_g12484.t1 [Chlamydomonas eustigma]